LSRPYLFDKVAGMDMRTLLRSMTEPERQVLAAKVDSSVGYLRLIAGGHRRPSTDLAKKLVEADGRLSLAELRPDVWGPPEPSGAAGATPGSVVG
jgi:hypothetical protein